MIEEEEKGHQNEGMKEEKENEGNDDKDGTSERKEKTKEEINGQLDEGKEKEGGKDIKTDKGEGKGIRKDRIGELARFLEDYHLTKTEVKMGMEEEEAKKMEREKREEEEKEVRAKEEEEKKVIKQEEEETKKWETEQNQTIDEPSPDTPNLPPRNIELVVDVLERCAHLLHMGGRGGRLLTLEVAKWGCRALTNHQDQLLPCLHKLWRPLLLCLTHSDLVVGVRTLVFVSETVALSGDFLRRRVATEALPLVHKFLRNQSVAVATKECITGTTKAVRTYLTTLTALVPRLNLGVTETAEIVEIAGLFLDLRHPPEVTRAALGLLEKVAETCPEHVWLSLAVGLPAACLTHPSPLLPPVKEAAACPVRRLSKTAVIRLTCAFLKKTVSSYACDSTIGYHQ
ncbi:TELO2-interacting protein 1 [Chionoecetes opilio]|uniref:TELO2-interacting protein 1 n=1 Tax=Chionoecetes opilio TaxID=41210 RepID=A0A8J5CFB4_CHIOP|nr:TELO2-interacting protein 1 [Chionoecetes opilio]